ncbi:hypothetical protein FJ251_12895 [bacterium]|nr:hypothetical protein [bacterium]
MPRLLAALPAALLMTALLAGAPAGAGALRLAELAGPADYDPALPPLDALLGVPWGERPVAGETLLAACQRLAAASPRVELLHYGSTHEGRPLVCAVVGSEAAIAKLEALRAARVARLQGGAGDASLPLVVWVGANVHGDEASGADAALALLYHLAADRSAATDALIERVLVLVDPVQNPDGRARFLADWQAWSSAPPVVDDQDLARRGDWPTARGNHYLLDLNRDWFTLSQPETRGRVALFLDWYPALSVDLHEMSGFSTTLFSPPRAPFNPHLPASTPRWWETLSGAVAEAFGRRAWPCATGDWNEEFNPNRGAAWPLHLGTVAFLVEQATTRGGALLRPDGALLDYAGCVARQFTAAWTLVDAAARNAEAIAADQFAARRAWRGEAADGTRAYLVDGAERPEAARALAAQLTRQGIRVEQLSAPLRAEAAVDLWGERRGAQPFAAGSFLVDLDQPEGRLAAAILDVDPLLPDSVLTRERRRLEAGEASELYEPAAWSPALASGAAVYTLRRAPRATSAPWTPAPLPPGGLDAAAPLGWLLHPEDPRFLPALTGLLKADLGAAACVEGFRREGRAWPAGSVFVPRAEGADSLTAQLARLAAATGAEFVGVAQALAAAGPDLGSDAWRPLRRPRVALLAGPPFHPTSFGTLWQHLEAELGLAVTRLRFDQLDTADLDRYSAILLPDAPRGRGAALRPRLGEAGWTRLRDWVLRGGTLIATGESAWLLFPSAVEGPGAEALGALRPRRQVLSAAASYLAESRRLAALPALGVDGARLRAGDSLALGLPALAPAPPTPALPELEAADAWQRRFAPAGCILRVDLDAEHWLAAGAGERVAAMVDTDLALLARQPAQIVGRLAPAATLRLAGLLWPEASARWAETVYLSREPLGDGQVIAFLGNPCYRGAFRGTARLFDNALLLGPGLGTRPRPFLGD